MASAGVEALPTQTPKDKQTYSSMLTASVKSVSSPKLSNARQPWSPVAGNSLISGAECKRCHQTYEATSFSPGSGVIIELPPKSVPSASTLSTNSTTLLSTTLLGTSLFQNNRMPLMAESIVKETLHKISFSIPLPSPYSTVFCVTDHKLKQSLSQVMVPTPPESCKCADVWIQNCTISNSLHHYRDSVYCKEDTGDEPTDHQSQEDASVIEMSSNKKGVCGKPPLSPLKETSGNDKDLISLNNNGDLCSTNIEDPNVFLENGDDLNWVGHNDIHGNDDTPQTFSNSESDIHADRGSDTASEYYSDSDCEESSFIDGNLEPSSYSGGDVDHPTTSKEVAFRKLLSDESGYCENEESSAMHHHLDLWRGESVQFVTNDNVEWDEESSDDGDTGEGDGNGDALWKSFENCFLSPQNLCIIGSVRERSIPSPPPKKELPNEVTSNSMVQSTTTDCVISDKHESRVKEQHDVVSVHSNDSSCLAIGSTPSDKKNPRIDSKRVHFPDNSKICVVHEIIAWNFAYRMARRGRWEEVARNRVHFKRRIDNLASILEPCLANKLTRINHGN